MTATAFLDAAERLVRALRAVDHPLPDHLRPGLDDARIAAAIESTGLRLPDEAAALWRWADGVGPMPPGTRPGGAELPGGLEFPSLERAIATYREHLEIFPWEDTPPELMRRSWFPAFVSGEDDYWLHTEAEAAGDVPVTRIYRADLVTDDMIEEHTTPSLAAMFDDMVHLVEGGHWRLVASPARPDEPMWTRATDVVLDRSIPWL